MLKILIADDHEVIRRGIRQILLEEFSSLKISEVVDTASLITKATRGDWDLIISDISMPGGGGIEALSRILEKKAHQRILIVSVYPAEQYIVQVLRAGAFGFLSKDTAPEELINAVKSILAGHKYVHPALAEKMGETLREKAGLLSHELLSHFEREIMIRLASGISVWDISNQFGISLETFNAYHKRIIEKTGVITNEELTSYAIENNLL